MSEFYVMWKYGFDRTRIGNDINEKRKPELASRKNAWYFNALYIRDITAKNTTDGVE